jgi:hypothetical protein
VKPVKAQAHRNAAQNCPQMMRLGDVRLTHGFNLHPVPRLLFVYTQLFQNNVPKTRLRKGIQSIPSSVIYKLI